MTPAERTERVLRAAAYRRAPVALIVRGVPGAGKTTLARAVAPVVVEADDAFVGDDGRWVFDPDRLGEAHANCFRRFVAALERGATAAPGSVTVAVANTASTPAEVTPYDLAARAYGHAVLVVRLDGPAAAWNRRGVHGVPDRVAAAMAAALKAPLPPWIEELVLR